MSLQSVKWNRIRYRLQGGEYHRFLARFSSVRWLHRKFSAAKNSLYGDLNSHLLNGNPGLFDICPNTALDQLRQNGLATGLQVPQHLVDDIVNHGLVWLPEVYDYDENAYRDPHHFDVPDPISIDSVRTLAEDPLLLHVARAYMGYRPRLQLARLWWLVPAGKPQNGMALEPDFLHWDIWSYNGVSAFFYFTDVKPESGAHIMVKGTHTSKPKNWNFGSSEQAFSTILRHFPMSQIAVIEGKPGTGFVEDPFSIHGTLPCLENRLMLQIRYV